MWDNAKQNGGFLANLKAATKNSQFKSLGIFYLQNTVDASRWTMDKFGGPEGSPIILEGEKMKK